MGKYAGKTKVTTKNIYSKENDDVDKSTQNTKQYVEKYIYLGVIFTEERRSNVEIKTRFASTLYEWFNRNKNRTDVEMSKRL